MGVNEDGDGAFQQAFCVPAVPLHENILMGGERSWGAQGSTPRVLTPPESSPAGQWPKTEAWQLDLYIRSL